MAHVEDRWYRPGPGGGKTPTARYGKGRRWRVRYTDPAGRERGRSFDRKTDADRFRALVETDVLRGTYLDPSVGRVTFKAYAGQVIRDRTLAPSTRDKMARTMAKHVYPVIGDRHLGQLARSPSTIQSLIARLRTTLEDSSAQVVMAYVATVFNCAVADERIAKNPCKAASVTLPKPPQRKVTPWTPGQVAAVRAALPDRYQAVVDCGAGLGLRQGEIAGLSPDDVAWLRDTVHVRRQVHVVRRRLVFAPPKGGKERDVPLPEAVKLALADTLRRWPAIRVTLPWLEPGGEKVTVPLIFTGPRGGPLHPEKFNERVWRPARRAAGLADVPANGLHALRHHYASVLLHGGADIKAVQEALGHGSAVITLDLYGHLMPGAGERVRTIIDSAREAADGPRTSQGIPEAGDTRR